MVVLLLQINITMMKISTTHTLKQHGTPSTLQLPKIESLMVCDWGAGVFFQGTTLAFQNFANHFRVSFSTINTRLRYKQQNLTRLMREGIPA